MGDRHLFVFNINNGKFLWDRLLLISVALLDGEDKKFVVVSSQNSIQLCDWNFIISRQKFIQRDRTLFGQPEVNNHHARTCSISLFGC